MIEMNKAVEQEQVPRKKDKKKDLENVKVFIVLQLEVDPITNELTLTATAEANASRLAMKLN